MLELGGPSELEIYCFDVGMILPVSAARAESFPPPDKCCIRAENSATMVVPETLQVTIGVCHLWSNIRTY